MSVIDKATQHFQSRNQKVIDVKEWETSFIVKPMTLDEQRRLLEKSQKSQVEALVDLIIMKCLKEDLSPAFKLSDKPKLMHEVDPTVITDIANKITGDSTVMSEKKS